VQIVAGDQFHHDGALFDAASACASRSNR